MNKVTIYVVRNTMTPEDGLHIATLGDKGLKLFETYKSARSYYSRKSNAVKKGDVTIGVELFKLDLEGSPRPIVINAIVTALGHFDECHNGVTLTQLSTEQPTKETLAKRGYLVWKTIY